MFPSNISFEKSKSFKTHNKNVMDSQLNLFSKEERSEFLTKLKSNKKSIMKNLCSTLHLSKDTVQNDMFFELD